VSAPLPGKAKQAEPYEPRVLRLEPGNTHIFEGTFALMHCSVKNEGLYRGVFAVLLFPISHPNRFISLRCTDEADKIQEIGVIDRLGDFPEEAQTVIRASLQKQYYEQTILRIHVIKCEYGLLFLDVETQRGREKLMMPWRHERAQDFGEDGKVLIDAFDNRYVIPNVSALTPAEQRRFRSFIYW
jgi:hypothetical protein